MTLYRKKPAVVEARQVPDPFDYDETCAVLGWINDNGGSAVAIDSENDDKIVAYVWTPEGNQFIDTGDWIVRGVSGYFFPVKPDVFEETFEPVLQPVPR